MVPVNSGKPKGKMPEYTIIGKSVTRLDALEKVTGQAKYCTDIKIPGMLHAKVLRSPHPSAKIIGIDTSKAEKLPGVVAVITGKDVPEKRYGASVFDQHVLARNVVRYVGDPVAAVAAISLDVAERALELIDVKYEEMPGVFDIEEAWQTSPPAVVHPDLPRYDMGKFPSPKLVPERPNVCNHRPVRHGDVEKGFKEADLIIENKFITAMQQHGCFEPQMCIAQAEADGGITIWASRQSIFLAKQYLCNLFGLPPSKIRLITSHYVGGGFGGKVTLYAEPIAIVLAKKTRRPVRLLYTREEMFTSGGNRIPCVIKLKDGVKKDGTIVAREITILLGMGAYSTSGPLITRNCIYGVVAGYRLPNLKADAYAVYTNEPFVTSFRGFGSPQAIWAIESQMDMIAEKLGMDAAELRRKNILKEGEINAVGEVVHSIGLRECLDKVTDLIEWDKKPKQEKGPWRRGRGVALGNKYSMAPTTALAIVKVLEDGTIEVRESADEIGQGSITAMAQIAAEEFRTSLDKVRVAWGDTNFIPYASRGSTSQRSTFNVGNAVRLAAKDAKRQLFEIAAQKLQAPPADLDIKDGKIYVRSKPSKTIEIRELFSAERALMPNEFGNYLEKQAEILGKGIWITPVAPSDPETAQIPLDIAKKGGRLTAFYGYGAQAIEVLVNIETGEVKVDKIAAAADVGYPINPKMCEQQIEGCIVMGVGTALWEEIMLDKGKVLNPNFRDYKMASASDMPLVDDLKISLVSAIHKDGPYGAKGMGETQISPTAPAIGNAIYNAVGIRIKDSPVTRESILKALQEKAKTK